MIKIIYNRVLNNSDIFVSVAIGIVSRLAPHPANMTAVGAMSFFAGAKFSIKKALAITLSTMLITDLFLGIHSVMWATYGSLLGAILIGKLVTRNNSISGIVGGSLLSSSLFFLVTNFAVWLAPNFMYPKTLAGLADCYIMALPFFRNTILGDLFYVSVFFGGYETAGVLRKMFGHSKVEI